MSSEKFSIKLFIFHKKEPKSFNTSMKSYKESIKV